MPHSAVLWHAWSPKSRVLRSVSRHSTLLKVILVNVFARHDRQRRVLVNQGEFSSIHRIHDGRMVRHVPPRTIVTDKQGPFELDDISRPDVFVWIQLAAVLINPQPSGP